MKDQVENLLKTAKERIIAENEQKIASEKQKREEHLISLGLIDENKTGGRTYVNYYSEKVKRSRSKSATAT